MLFGVCWLLAFKINFLTKILSGTNGLDPDQDQQSPPYIIFHKGYQQMTEVAEH